MLSASDLLESSSLFGPCATCQQEAESKIRSCEWLDGICISFTSSCGHTWRRSAGFRDGRFVVIDKTWTLAAEVAHGEALAALVRQP